MDEKRKTCNLGYFHLPHSTTVMLLDENGVMANSMVVFCGGVSPDES